MQLLGQHDPAETINASHNTRRSCCVVLSQRAFEFGSLPSHSILDIILCCPPRIDCPDSCIVPDIDISRRNVGKTIEFHHGKNRGLVEPVGFPQVFWRAQADRSTPNTLPTVDASP